MPGRFFEMGRVGRPHGIKGEIGVEWLGELPPARNTPIFLSLPGQDEPRAFMALQARPHKGRLLLTLEEIQTREQAEKLKGAKILLPRECMPELDPDEAYLQDLMGCEVVLPNGSFLGRLDHVEFPAGQEIWAIVDDNGNEILFPARQSFIKDFNLDGGRIVIDPPPGLVDIYRA